MVSTTTFMTAFYDQLVNLLVRKFCCSKFLRRPGQFCLPKLLFEPVELLPEPQKLLRIELPGCGHNFIYGLHRHSLHVRLRGMRTIIEPAIYFCPSNWRNTYCKMPPCL